MNLDSFKQIFLVMEYFECDLKKILNSVHRGLVLEEDHIITLIYNSLCSLNFIHSANLMHRDLKPGNLLVDEKTIARFGERRPFTASAGGPHERAERFFLAKSSDVERRTTSN